MTLEERIEQLERTNAELTRRCRRISRFGIAGATLAGAVVMMGVAAPKEKDIEAQTVTLVDAHGHKRLVLGSIDRGVGLALISEEGKNLIELGLDASGAGLDIKDIDGHSRVTVGADKKGAGLAVLDERGTKRVIVGEGTVPQHGAGAGLWVFDKQGKPRLGAALGDEGKGGVIQLDENGKPVDR